MKVWVCIYMGFGVTFLAFLFAVLPFHYPVVRLVSLVRGVHIAFFRVHILGLYGQRTVIANTVINEQV